MSVPYPKPLAGLEAEERDVVAGLPLAGLSSAALTAVSRVALNERAKVNDKRRAAARKAEQAAARKRLAKAEAAAKKAGL